MRGIKRKSIRDVIDSTKKRGKEVATEAVNNEGEDIESLFQDIQKREEQIEVKAEKEVEEEVGREVEETNQNIFQIHASEQRHYLEIPAEAVRLLELYKNYTLFLSEIGIDGQEEVVLKKVGSRILEILKRDQQWKSLIELIERACQQ
jgi:hypothetical protein